MVKHPNGWREPQVLMLHLNVTNAKLAALTGYSRPYITQLITGSRTVSIDALHRIASALGVMPHMLSPRQMSDAELIAAFEALASVEEDAA